MRIIFVIVITAMLTGVCGTRANWPEFRGPSGDGHVGGPGNNKPVGLPLQWSESEHVQWRIEIPERGWSTPVVMDDQVWLTTATMDGHDLYAICVDTRTGKIRMNTKVFHVDDPEPLGNPVNSYASPSPVIEKGKLYVHFGSYGTACLDTETGKTLWQRRDLPCRHFRGPGSSVVLFENLLIITMDGIDLQYMVALDKATGKTVWKTNRSAEWHDLDAKGKPSSDGDFRKAYCTPLIVTVNGKPQMFSVGAKAAYSYDPRTGQELWKVHNKCYSAAARPVFGQGLAFLVTGFGKTELWAVRPDGHGDVTDTHVVWKLDKSVARTPSPIVVDDLVFVISDEGFVSCLEAATGKLIWKERLTGKFLASPICADGRIYFFNDTGKTFVIKAGRKFELLATNSLGAGFMASPAVAGQALILRTKTHLYRVE